MKVTQVLTFEAAHFLPNVPDGHKCKRMHGHSYRVELTFEGPVDPETGFVIDYFEIERIAAPLVEFLDHRLLNEIRGLGNPTVEHIATWFAEGLNAGRKGLKLFCSAVRVYETPTSWAEWP